MIDWMIVRATYSGTSRDRRCPHYVADIGRQCGKLRNDQCQREIVASTRTVVHILAYVRYQLFLASTDAPPHYRVWSLWCHCHGWGQVRDAPMNSCCGQRSVDLTTINVCGLLLRHIRVASRHLYYQICYIRPASKSVTSFESFRVAGGQKFSTKYRITEFCWI